jgi:hypothetical protein
MNTDNIKLFTQPDRYGCVIASIAMCTNTNYHELSGKYIAHDLNRQGYNTECQNKIINDLGFSTNVIKYLPKTDDTVCILTVPSLNNTKFLHAIVYITASKYKHARVYDPNENSPFEDVKFYTLKMIRNLEAKQLADCTVITKDDTIKSVSYKKTINVTPFTKEDCKKCTFGPVVNNYSVAGGSLYGGSDYDYD